MKSKSEVTLSTMVAENRKQWQRDPKSVGMLNHLFYR